MSDDSVSWDLQQFFGANFHQDWDLEADNWQGIVDGYVKDSRSTADKLRNLATEIENLPLVHTEFELEQVIAHKIGVDFDPRPLPYGVWLGQIAHRLREHAELVDRNTE